MTNAEKFKEVFGYKGEDFSSEYYCPFNSEICGSKTCRDCIRDWWQSEYKEPFFNFDTPLVVKVEVNAKWQKAIDTIKAEIESVKDEPIDEKSKHYNLGLDVSKTIIDKRTKELI